MPASEIYLNHAGTSWPKPQAVQDAVQDAMTRPPTAWGERFERAHHAIAASFGIRNPGQLLLTPGCTSSLATAINDIDLGGRKRILTSTWEHHAMHRPLLKLAGSGVRLDYVPANGESPFDLDRLEQYLAKGDVGLVAITASSNVTGDLLPYKDVIELAHRHDTQVLLDAAQIAGWLDLDVGSLGADLVAFGGHKGLQGPWGIGGLYVGDSARMNCVRTRRDPGSSNQMLRPGYCDVGSVDQIALAGLHAGVEWLKRVDRTAQLDTGREQISRIAARLVEAGARCFGIQEPSYRMPTVAFSVSNRSSNEIAAALKRLGIIVGSGLQCAPLAHQTLGTESQGLVRISIGIGQNGGDVEAAVEPILAQVKP